MSICPSNELQKNPQQRYQNASEIIEDFQEISKPLSTTHIDSKENICSAGKSKLKSGDLEEAM